MKLILFFNFGFLYLTVISLYFTNDGYLQKDQSKDTYNGDALYLDTNEFKDESYAYIKIVAHHGTFSQKNLYYGGYSNTPETVNLESSLDYYFNNKYNYKSEYSDTDTDDISYFKIPIPKEKYLFFSIPNYNAVNGSVATVSFDSTQSVGEIIGIIVGVLVGLIIIILLIAYCVKSRSRKFENNESPVYVPLIRYV